MFVGIDLGTSSVKAVLLDRAGTVRARAGRALTLSQPQPQLLDDLPIRKRTLDAVRATLTQVWRSL